MSELKHTPMSVGLAHRDPKAALQWLEAAFGFETTLVVLDDKGDVGHSEIKLRTRL